MFSLIHPYVGVNKSRTYTAQTIMHTEIKRYGKIIATKMGMDIDVINKDGRSGKKKCSKP